MYKRPVTVAARSKTWIWAAGLLGLRVRILPWELRFVSCECCELLRWADYSSRGVLLNVVRRCVRSGNLKNKEALAQVRPQRHGEKI